MQTIDIPADHGHLEALYWPQAQPWAQVAILHPHPLLGGTMHHLIPYRLARAFRASGATALRIQFRGVGRSTGRYAAGEGEQDDARAALDFLARERPDAPLWLAGFSFGAYVALRHALRDPRVKGLLCVGLPVSLFPPGDVSSLRVPTWLFQAERDEYGSPEAVQQALAGAPGPVTHVRLTGGHLLDAPGELDALEAAVAAVLPR
jgi:hypothetical protein